MNPVSASGMTMLCVLSSIAGIGTRAAAQTLPQAKDVTYAVPKAPAFNLIGVNPEEITRPGTARELATALMSAVDTAGRLVQGFAFDLSPALLLIPALNLKEYQRSVAKRILYNTTISAGTAKATGDSTSTQLAVGFQSVLLDRTDPMNRKEYTDSLAKLLLSCIDVDPLAQAIACGRAAQEKHRKGFVRKYWNDATAAVGAAVGWQFTQSRIDQAGFFGTSVWLTGGVPLGNFGQLLVQGQYQARSDSVPDQYDGLTYGGKLLMGSAVFNGFVELIGQQLQNAPPAVDASTAEWSAGVEFRATEETWVATGLGSRFADETRESRVYLIAGIRWSVSTGPNFR